MNQNNKLYYIEYQILVKEPEYNKLCQTTQIISENPPGRFEFEFIPKIFYGRTNILYFKLCHNYCDSCSLKLFKSHLFELKSFFKNLDFF